MVPLMLSFYMQIGTANKIKIKWHKRAFTYWLNFHYFPPSFPLLPKQNQNLSQEDPRVHFDSSWLLIYL